MNDKGRLSGKVLVVGGGAAGTGKAISEWLSAEGAIVVIGDVDCTSAEALAETINAKGGKASAFAFTNKDDESVAALIEHAIEAYGRIDAVHMIAGNPEAMQSEGNVLDISRDTWIAEMQAHLFAPAQAARSAIPRMIEQGGGSIVFTSSAAARRNTPNMVGYQTAKSGVETLTRHIAETFGKQGVRCNCLTYGLIMTEKAHRLIDQKVLDQNFVDAALAATWSPRLGLPTDAAAIAALLHSDEGEWINGQVIDLNGGGLMRS